MTVQGNPWLHMSDLSGKVTCAHFAELGPNRRYWAGTTKYKTPYVRREKGGLKKAYFHKYSKITMRSSVMYKSRSSWAFSAAFNPLLSPCYELSQI